MQPFAWMGNPMFAELWTEYYPGLGEEEARALERIVHLMKAILHRPTHPRRGVSETLGKALQLVKAVVVANPASQPS